MPKIDLYDSKEVGNRIRKLRKEKKLTIQELLTGAGVDLSENTWYRVESGARELEEENLRRIADFFCIDCAWIRYGSMGCRIGYSGDAVYMVANRDAVFDEQMDQLVEKMQEILKAAEKE